LQDSDFTNKKELDLRQPTVSYSSENPNTREYSRDAFVFLKNSNNRKATSDDILIDKIDAYFNQNGEHPTIDTFRKVFKECRSLCKNCLYFREMNILREPAIYQGYANQVGNRHARGKPYGRCFVQPPIVISNPNSNKMQEFKVDLKTVHPIVYPNSYCSQFYHNIGDVRYKGPKNKKMLNPECVKKDDE